MTRMSKTILMFAVALMLVLPSAALAQNPGVEGYRGSDGTVQGIVESGGSGSGGGNGSGGGGGAEGAGAGTDPSASQQSTGSGSKGGSLPFTGADLGVLAFAGGLLVLMGFGLRRMTHRTSEV